MANNNSQGRAARLPSPPNANSPLSPGSGGSNPISFQPNVNRAKTKRWVEAKQYSYDGGDWGDEDDEEEEEEEAPPVPRPPPANRTGSSSELSSRRLSGLALGAEASRGSPSADVKPAPNGGDQQQGSFVRPADIYKRMQEKSPPSEAAGSAQQPGALPTSLQPGGSGPHASGARDEAPKPDELHLSSGPGHQAPAIGLPELKRVSAFGTDFLGGGDSGSQQQASSESPQTSLQHQPSQGFTSAVHQAFDVPETPDSTAGSVVRSNSDGTSVISPIMNHQSLHDDRTPTIPEEPAEASTPTGAGPKEAANDGPVFKPGHRRDMSLPESDNSPSKRPAITDHEAPPAGQAEMSAVSPTKTNEKDFVAPLKFGSHSNPGSEGYRGEIPTIVPAAAGASPEDTDNDRLREEIIRSLSRENSQEPELPPQQPPAMGSGQGEAPKSLEPHPLASQDPYTHSQTDGGGASAAAEPPKSKLGRRFSWESTSSSDEPAPQVPGSYSSPPPLNTSLAVQEPEPLLEDGASKELGVSDSEGSDGQRHEKPRLSIIPPVAENSSPPQQIMGPVDAPESPREVPLVAHVGTLPIDESKLKGFRDILNMTLPNERIRAFEYTRDQFAVLDTGLNNWLQVTINENPDHADLVQQSRSLSSGFPRPSPSRTKFPKLGSLGNLASSKEDVTPASATHNRRPSGHMGTIVNRQNVEQRSKDFLHSAGAFGGKAGEAAKGLFAKGRSKFRPGGTDKGQSTTARRSLHFSFTSESNGAHGNSSLRNSVNLNSLPMFKFGGNKSSGKEQSDSYDEERAGKRLKSNGALNGSTQTTDPSAPSKTDRRQSEGFPDQSNMAGDLEQEMIAALGLSPTEAHSKQPAPAGPVINQSDASPQSPLPPPLPAKDDAPASESKDLDPPSKKPAAEKAEKELPAPPPRDLESPSSAVPQVSSGPAVETTGAMIPSIRAIDEDKKPDLPPKDLPPNDLPKDTPSKDLAPPQGAHARDPSVSTLGADEKDGGRPTESDTDDPPSPLHSSTDEAKSDEPVYGKPASKAKESSVSLPSIEEHVPGFAPVYPPRPTSSAQVLESKRQSISGPPPSTPGVQSPLRNEVRYSPGTRSSMLSFGSWGKRSTGSRGTHPQTPVNDQSQRRASGTSLEKNGDSAMDKLKSFGKRRRASVGDLLTGIQDNIQGGLQGRQSGGQNKGHQRKRTFSRINDLFNRSRDSDDDSHGQRSNSGDRERRNLSATSSKDRRRDSSAHSVRSEDQVLSSPPVPGLAASLPPASSEPSTTRDSRQRASMPPPANPQGGGRFYSQLAAAAAAPAPASTQHTRVRSQPTLGHQPMFPTAPLESEQGNSRPSPPLSRVQEADELGSPKEEYENPPLPRKSNEPAVLEQNDPLNQGKEEKPSDQGKEHPAQQPEQQAQEAPSQPQNQEQKTPEIENQSSQESIQPNANVRSRKPIESNPEAKDTLAPEPKNIAVSGTSTVSDHPHRDQARVVNETNSPVELALTKDDSSEEIVMSPTTYPGQEWTPMHL